MNTGEFPREWTAGERHNAAELARLRKTADTTLELVLNMNKATSNHADRIIKLESGHHDLAARVDHIERSITLPAEGRRTRWFARRLVVAMAALVVGGGLAALVLDLARST